jgi:hypothetical protein
MRRTLVALACYFVLVHAAVTAWAAVHPLVMPADGGNAAAVICYGNPDKMPDGAKGGAVKLSCAVCAASAALAAAPANAIEFAYSPLVGSVDYNAAVAVPASTAPPRSGLSRAPPLAA